eukprot:gene18933-7063_t
MEMNDFDPYKAKTGYTPANEEAKDGLGKQKREQEADRVRGEERRRQQQRRSLDDAVHLKRQARQQRAAGLADVLQELDMVQCSAVLMGAGIYRVADVCAGG